MTDLPVPMASYIAAINRHDIDGMLACFTEAAIVRDERETHTGLTEIRSWIAATTDKYRVTVDLLDATPLPETVTAAMRVSGTFPGSPITLHYHFAIDGGRIAALEIGA